MSLAALHWLLYRQRASRPRNAEKRLLLLRPFFDLDAHEDLLDDLRDSWQRLGAIDLFVGPDVHTRTLRPKALLLRRARTAGDREIEADARYRLNGIECDDEAWLARLPALENTADVVLMDLRGVTVATWGLKQELDHLREHRDMRRTVFLVDGNTSFPLVSALLEGHAIDALDYTDRTDDDRRALFDLLLQAAYVR
jgi:hypothetical protein